MDLNSVAITARATKDTELKTTQSGTNIATISAAVNGAKDEVSYFDIVCFSKTAVTASLYVGKGKQIAVQGRLHHRKWQDKDGNNRYAVEIIANQLKLLGGKEASSTAQNQVIDDFDDAPISLDDLPF